MRYPHSARASVSDAKTSLAAIRPALTSKLDRRVEADARPSQAPTDATGSFETHAFSNGAGTRSYKLYVPAKAFDGPRPVVVMLHGCTQSADDFATGTQMNLLADEHGFLVIYPQQPAHANLSKCWNWYKQQDQLRNGGEPSLIAGIVRQIVRRPDADPHRVFVAGLSAGAAMAIILGETYPELFAGVGAHSGMPYGSAHGMLSAMNTMKRGRSRLTLLHDMLHPAMAAPGGASQAMPTIVFHGDCDHTVQQTNGSEIARQATQAYLDRSGEVTCACGTHAGKAPGGRRYRRTVHFNRKGQAQTEFWIVRGAGHAWSGGDARGSYTDRSGPDASAEMTRFFLALPPAVSGPV